MYRITIWQQVKRGEEIERFVTWQADPEYLDEYTPVTVRLFDSEDAAAEWLYAKAEEQPLPALKNLCFTCEEVNEANVIGNLHTDLGDV